MADSLTVENPRLGDRPAASPAAPAGRRRRHLARAATWPAGLLAAACGAFGGAAPPEAGGGVVEVRVQSRQAGSGAPEVEYWERIVARYNERQGKVHVTFEAWPPDSGPVVLAVAGTLGDVVRLGGWGGQFPEMAVKGFIRDLAPLVQRDRYDLRQFYAPSVETLSLGGKQFGLPHVAHPGFSGQYVNLDALAQAGIPEPNDATWMYADLEDVARRLATGLHGGESGRWAAWPPTMLQHVVVATRAFGGELLTRDGKRSLVAEPASVQGLQVIADMILKHRLAPPPGALSGSGVQNFIQGNVAIVWWNAFILSTLAQQGQGLRWKVLLGPRGPKGRGIFMTTDVASLNAATKHPDLAFDVLKHVISKESNFEWFERTRSPGGRVDFWTDARVSADPAYRVFTRAIEESAPLNLVPNGLGDEHNRMVDKELSAIWSGKASVRDGAEAARRAAQEVLDRPAG